MDGMTEWTTNMGGDNGSREKGRLQIDEAEADGDRLLFLIIERFRAVIRGDETFNGSII